MSSVGSAADESPVAEARGCRRRQPESRRGDSAFDFARLSKTNLGRSGEALATGYRKQEIQTSLPKAFRGATRSEQKKASV